LIISSELGIVQTPAYLERVHFHIVSTRIDCETGKKIKDNYEKEKTQRFIKDLEQKYQLTKDDIPEKLNFRFSNSSKDLKQNLENLFGQLSSMDFIISKEMYDQALKLFQVEIRKAGRGHLVFVTDENGNPIRHPVKMSDFQELPKYFHGKSLVESEDHQIINNSQSLFYDNSDFLRKLKMQVVKGLLSQNSNVNGMDHKKKINKIKRKKNGKQRRL
jgi:hypothetical protein